MDKKQPKLNLFENHTTDLQKNFAPPPAILSSSRSDPSADRAKPAKFRGWSGSLDRSKTVNQFDHFVDPAKLDGGIFITSDRQKNGSRLLEYLAWKRKEKFGGSPSANENTDSDSNNVEDPRSDHDWSKSDW